MRLLQIEVGSVHAFVATASTQDRALTVTDLRAVGRDRTIGFALHSPNEWPRADQLLKKEGR